MTAKMLMSIFSDSADLQFLIDNKKNTTRVINFKLSAESL